MKKLKINFGLQRSRELIYEWELGSMLIFDRSNLHCSSSVIEGKKIGSGTYNIFKKIKWQYSIVFNILMKTTCLIFGLIF